MNRMTPLFAALAGFACASALSQELEPATPESQGVSSAAILRWVEACENDAATNRFGSGYVHGFVILRHGRRIAEGSLSVTWQFLGGIRHGRFTVRSGARPAEGK